MDLRTAIQKRAAEYASECPICGSDHTKDSPEMIEALHSLSETLSKPYTSPDRSTSILPRSHEMYGGMITDHRDGHLRVTDESGTRKVDKLYRVVHPKEWEEAQRNGYLQSNSPYSQGYTRASARPDERWRYQSADQLEAGTPGHTLEIDYHPDDKWHASAEGYAATRSRIPLSRVRKIERGP